MLRRYGRVLVTLYVVSDAMLGILAFGVAYVLRFSSGLIPVTRGYPPFEQYVAVMPFVAVLVPLAYYFQGGLSPATRPVARRRFLPRLHRHRRGRDSRHCQHALRGRVPCVAGAAGCRRLSGVARRLGAVPGHQHRACIRLARARPRAARTALESGYRAEANSDCRRRRAGPRRRREDPPARRARISGRSASSTIAPEATTWLSRFPLLGRLRTRRRSSARRISTTSTLRCRSRST